MNITIDNTDLTLLKSITEFELGEVVISPDRDRFRVDAAKEIFEYVLDKLADELASKGLNGNQEINPYGLQLEHLIDKISNVVYE